MTETENGPSPKIIEKNLTPTEVLNSIIEPSRAPSSEYQSLIRRQEDRSPESRHLTDDFASHWTVDIKNESAIKDLLKSHLQCKTVLDLGGGQGNMGKIAQELGATTYINVERAPFDETLPLSPTSAIKQSREDNFLSLLVHADMLDFISRLKDGSIDNLVINGIDTFVIDDHAYHAVLVREILRVTRNGALIFGRSSDALENIKEQLLAAQKRGAVVNLPIRLIDIKFTNGIFFEKME